ncbi:Mg(2+) transport ATPase protein C [Halanaerobium saccharolyticum subsp. saccharolyticum DSM 6643]|uniref:Mg(2+) transport ATPase protein C n=1 Tax=Halanaerobium saccharolyticum subsp. saccharolyticum DSM 6643 TaxID=1293054 RepID=M5EF03_9FIRM|nr:MgtC/SapB family protein [Halanaerobium saccharolyticum]CCU79682.1 Mg(2+) transport ATPase protein C [Halanaerobium saccharolyticum subsp. saccharolyticum DSM 6643]
MRGEVIIFEYALRLFLSAILGGIVGTEREKRDKAAGIRTYALVAVTSCLIMLTSYNLAMDLGDEKAYADAARIAAQVVSGVGFLGAGTILKNDNKIRGLTTAAGLWSVAGIGLAVGMGYYFIAIITTLIIVVTLAFI